MLALLALALPLVALLLRCQEVRQESSNRQLDLPFAQLVLEQSMLVALVLEQSMHVALSQRFRHEQDQDAGLAHQ